MKTMFDSIKDVKWGYFVCLKASIAALRYLPYCLKRRQVCTAPDFEPPLK